MFGLKHIILLCVCAAYVALTLLITRKKRPELKIVLKSLLVVGGVSETLKVFTYVVDNEAEKGGYLPKTDLPFHLCSVQIIFMLILVLSENERLRRVLLSFMYPTCLIGGIAAMLLPTYSALNNPVITVQYFLYHSSIVIFAIYLISFCELKFEFRDYVSALLMLYGFFFVAIYLNSWVNDYRSPINFMYVVDPPVEGLPFLNRDHGWLVYIIHYAFLAAFCVTACYIKPVVKKITEKLRKS